MLLSRLTYNTEQVGQATTDSIVVLIRDTLTIVGSIGYLFYLNCEAGAVQPDRGSADRVADHDHQPLFRRYSRRIQDSMGDVTRVAKEALDAPRVVKVFNAQDYQNAQFRDRERAQPRSP